MADKVLQIEDMTLRDVLAAFAVMGYVAACGIDQTFPEPAEAAKESYVIADAMLAARQ